MNADAAVDGGEKTAGQCLGVRDAPDWKADVEARDGDGGGSACNVTERTHQTKGALCHSEAGSSHRARNGAEPCQQMRRRPAARVPQILVPQSPPDAVSTYGNVAASRRPSPSQGQARLSRASLDTKPGNHQFRRLAFPASPLLRHFHAQVVSKRHCATTLAYCVSLIFRPIYSKGRPW